MFRSGAMEVGTDREGDAGSPPLASKWWERRDNCGSHQCTAPRAKLPRDSPPKTLLHTRVRGPQPSHSGSPKPGPRGPPARTQLGGPSPAPPPHLSPRLPGASSSSSAAEAARNAALHALRAAALRCALQPGEARVSADLGPSSPGSHGRASEQGEETGPCAVRRPASSRSPRPAPAPPLTC